MIVHPRTNSLVLAVDDVTAVQHAVSNAKLIPHGTYNIAVKHDENNTRALRSLGIDAPAPIHSRYDWPGKYKPFNHQRDMAEFLTMQHAAFNLSEMGVGKSAATLWAADYLMSIGAVRKVLILSPLSTLDRVWANDIFDVLMHRRCIIVHGTREKRLAALKADVDFYILNHDGVVISDVNDAIRSHPDIDVIVVDEASMFRNAQTKKYKALHSILGKRRRWLLTGTPCPNAPTDAWALARLVEPTTVPQFFGQFKRQTMVQYGPYRWEARPDAHEMAFKALQPAVRFKKKDCLDLPPVTVTDLTAAPTPDQKRALENMRRHMLAEAASTKITAANAADKINKIRQILCGSVRDTETGNYLELPYGPRLDALRQCIQGASAKVLVVVPFKGIIKSLEKHLAKDYSVGVLNGDVPAKRRDEIIRNFKTTADPHLLLCHPKVMAHGLNLTEADTLIFYAPIYSNDEFQQVTERFNRSGQTRKMTIVRIGAHELEWKIYNMVDKKKDTQDNILDLYESITSNEV